MKNQLAMIFIRSGISMSQCYYLGMFIFFSFIISSCDIEDKIDTHGSENLQGFGFGISSATLMVQNIDSTEKYFTDVLGFNIPKFGGFNQSTFKGVNSVFIPFPDISAIEILAVDDSVDIEVQPSFIKSFLKNNEGVRTYSLSTSSVNETKNWLKNNGLKTDSVRAHYSDMNMGNQSSWSQNAAGMYSLDFDTLDPPPYLPRFEEIIGFEYQMMKEDWKTPFAYGRSFFQHPNGVVGILNLEILVEDMKHVRKQFQIMGLEELKSDNPKTFARYKIKGGQELHVKTSISSEDELAGNLEDHGPGVYSIKLEVVNLDSTYAFFKEKLASEALVLDTVTNQLTIKQEYAHGIQINFSQESKERTILAQKLKMGPKQDSMTSAYASELYVKYCELCHGKNRVGYAADYAPSLRSHSLLASSKNTNFLRYTMQYGRVNTAMAGYLMNQGGPLSLVEIEILLQWLEESSGVNESLNLSREPVKGDVDLGAIMYKKNCASCHGKDGEGVVGPALGNPMLLATATDEFLRYAIREGRENTLMPAFKDSLSNVEINALTAFLRSRASGWDVPGMDTFSVPKPEDYILNPGSPSPSFELREGRYVSAQQVQEALKDSARIVLLDARSTVAWRQTHIPGSIPVPYYEEPDTFLQYIPNDENTWIVAYCACPHAASGQVVNKLNQLGYKKTAIIDEGILVWAQLGYPVVHGQ